MRCDRVEVERVEPEDEDDPEEYNVTVYVRIPTKEDPTVAAHATVSAILVDHCEIAVESSAVIDIPAGGDVDIQSGGVSKHDGAVLTVKRV